MENLKKGFTLVELLGVIIILAIIALIIYPIFNESLTSSKEKLYQEQIESLERAARRWGVDNSLYIPEDANKCAILFDNLISGGFIANDDIVNPRNGSLLTGCISVYWDVSTNQPVYEYNETCKTGVTDITACVTP